jgi:hypothetical protein
MAFRGNDVGNGPWYCIVCPNKAIFGMCMGPGMGSKAPGADFQSDPRAVVFSFSGFRNSFFFCETAIGLCRAVIGDHIRTTYHIPYAGVCILGS